MYELATELYKSLMQSYIELQAREKQLEEENIALRAELKKLKDK